MFRGQVPVNIRWETDYQAELLRSRTVTAKILIYLKYSDIRHADEKSRSFGFRAGRAD